MVQGMETEQLLGLDIVGYLQLSLEFSAFYVTQHEPPVVKSAIQKSDKQVHGKYDSELSSLEKEQLQELLLKHSGVFSISQTNLGIFNVGEHEIAFTNLVSVHRRLCRASLAGKEEINRLSLFQQGLIRPPLSPYAASVIMASKEGEGKYGYAATTEVKTLLQMRTTSQLHGSMT